jgi:hypothetical protein
VLLCVHLTVVVMVDLLCVHLTVVVMVDLLCVSLHKNVLEQWKTFGVNMQSC